jgi:putative ABC transport system permease protein
MTGREHLDDLDEEIRDHLEREAQDNVDCGMTPEAARDAARRKFGNVAITKEDARGVWIPVWLDQLLQDARYGLRMLRRSPGFSAVVIATLALGIGMNTAVFSVVNAVLLRPLSFPHPDRVVWVNTIGARATDEHVAAPDFLAWRDATSLERLVAYYSFDDRVSRGDTIVPARIAMVSDDFWDLAGARPAVGRLPAPGEAAVMLSHSFFEHWFASDSEIVGKPVTIAGLDTTVAGVLPRGFHVQLPPTASSVRLPAKEIDAYRVFIVRPPTARSVQLLFVLALLKPRASISATRAELDTIHARVDRENAGPPDARRSDAMRSIPFEKGVRVIPLTDMVGGDARASLLVLFAAVVLVLLVASANIANLLLARASVRQREIAIRTAVGAGRGRVLRLSLVESLLLASIGGACGVFVARYALQMIVRLIPQAVPRLAETTIDARVLGFALTMSVMTALLFGFAPAMVLWRTSTYDVLKDGARTVTAGGLRARAWLVILELALTVVLLCGAGLLVKSLWRMHAYPPGFAPDRTLTMTVRFYGPASQDDNRRRAFVDEVLRRVPSLPGVEGAGVTTNGEGRMRLFIEGAPPMADAERPVVLHSSVSAGYAKAIGMRVITGRWLTDAEPNPVFVINESLARRDLVGEDPIGKRIQVGGSPGGWDATFATVVGVVEDLRYTRLDATPEPEIFEDYAHAAPFAATVVVRTAGDPMAIASEVRARVVEIDKMQDVSEVKTVEQVLADSIAPRRFNVFLFGTFAAAALLLALIGIYGVIAYSVAQRTHEIGVRLALGAERRAVVGMVVQQGMAIAAAGLLFGVVAAFAVTRVMASLLYDVTPTDPATFAVVAGMLGATAFAACWGPAVRAARVDPLVALRYE